MQPFPRVLCTVSFSSRTLVLSYEAGRRLHARGGLGLGGWGSDGGVETLAFFRHRRVFQRAIGRRRSEACAILKVIFGGESGEEWCYLPPRRCGHGGDTLLSGPGLGGKLRRARCCRGLWLVSVISCAVISSGVKIICGTGRGREKTLWGRYPLGVTGLEGPPPRAVPIWGVGGASFTGRKQLELGRPGCRRPGRAPEEAGGGGGGVAAGRTRRFKQILSLGSSSPELWRSPGLSRRESGDPARTPGALPGRSLPPLPVGRPSAAPVPPRRAQPRCPRWGLPLAARRVARAGPALAGPRGY